MTSRQECSKGNHFNRKTLGGVNYRAFFSALALLLVPGMAFSEDPRIIASFQGEGVERNWFSVNDGVMGGLSEGRIQKTDKALLFTGNLSLKNNGGFASIRTKPDNLNLKGASALVIAARGDGRTYWVDLRVKDQWSASSYRAYLTTEKGVLQKTSLPLSEFKLQSFGRAVSAKPLDPAAIASVGFTLADKKAGPFRLEIESIEATFEKGQSTAATGTIPEVAGKAGSFQTLLAAAGAAGLAGVLSGEGPFTVFAPTDKAFAKLPAGTVASLLKPENKGRLTAILKYHVIAGRIPLAKAIEAKEAPTLEGQALSIRFKDGRVLVGPATLQQADIPAANGVIHVIDQVLLPPEKATSPITPAALVNLAIERGVPLFNQGNPGACAAVYEVTCEALRQQPGLSETTQKDLADSLAKMRAEKTDTQKAWVLRYALDRFLTTQTKEEQK